MGFCRRCGEIVNADRCRCGGTSRDSTTNLLFGDRGSDKWSQRYLARSSSPTASVPSATVVHQVSDSSGARPASTVSTATPPARPPSSPSKLAESFLKGVDSDETELSCVFGSVLSPKDHWQCSSCCVKFRQEEVIYPHPEAKTEPAQFGELYFCRACFAERFRVGNCKKCKLAVLSDAKFIKHDQNLWHEPCYVCSYCPTSVVIDFAARPACEECFDSFAFKRAGLLPSPHLSQNEWNFKSTQAPPPPNKWGRPSMTGATSVWSSASSASRDPKALTPNGPSTKPAAWRIRQERENSPLVRSYDELGDKLRKVGLSSNDLPSSNAASSPARIVPQSPAATKPSPSLDNQTAVSLSSAREALQPVHQNSSRQSPVSPVKSPSTMPADGSGLQTALKPRSVDIPRRWAASGASITPFDSDMPIPTNSPSSLRDHQTCPVCRLELGYGDFVELGSGAILHKACFACEGCQQAMSGKYIEAEGKAYHKECAPAPQRIRTIVTSLGPASTTSPGNPTTSYEPRTADPEQEELTCAACSTLLGFGTSVTIPKSGKSYHSRCFTCAACARGFEKGFVEHGGLAYHDKCMPSIATTTLPREKIPTSPSSPSRTSRPPRLPTLPSFPPKHVPPVPLSPASLPVRSLYSTRQRPPSNLGGLLVCAGHYVSQMMNSKPKPIPLSALREQRALSRGQIFRANHSNLPRAESEAIKAHLVASYISGAYLKSSTPTADSKGKEDKRKQDSDVPNPLDPAQMDGLMDMVKKQAVGFLPQTILMYYINSFFSGFLLTRLPFPLTIRFKEMLQRGLIDVPDLDASWCSSISWFFLCSFGLNPVYRLLLGEENAASDLQQMQSPVAQMPQMPGAPQIDYKKLYRDERENLDIVEHQWACEGVQDRVLKMFR
ncbi:ER membrane complex subunit EMC3 [Sporobolomyces koalae]|uniref:ER membrane complex subunit EMC3 n=1 Tax=Sporobolomyces koalae TaxID=500713 RepID=UPI00316F5ED1